MNSDMPPEFGAVFMKKILGCKQLTDSMSAGDKQRVLATLIECAMTDIQLVRFRPYSQSPKIVTYP